MGNYHLQTPSNFSSCGEPHLAQLFTHVDIRTSLLYKHMIKHHLQSMIAHMEYTVNHSCPFSYEIQTRHNTTAVPKEAMW